MSADRDGHPSGAHDEPADESVADTPDAEQSSTDADSPASATTPGAEAGDDEFPAPSTDQLDAATNPPTGTGADADAGAGAPPDTPSIFAQPSAAASDDALTSDSSDRPAHAARRSGPLLPDAPAKLAPPMIDPMARPRAGTSTWYRTDDDRNRSVYRRANPWYRRTARAVIGVCFLGAAGLGIYAGARVVQNYLERDRIPAAGAEVPDFRSTTFLITSAAPAPELDGTLTLDTESGAFEFVGRASGPQSGLQVVSADGEALYVRQGTGTWRAATGEDPETRATRTAVDYLADADNADVILTNWLRRGYVDLVDKVDEGVGDDALTRYEMEVDTREFATRYPLQWQDFKQSAIPDAVESNALPVTIWLDRDGVLVRVRDAESHWAWERLTYSDQPFTVEPPAVAIQVVPVVCVTDESSWQSSLSSCDAAYDIGRQLAVTAGVTDQADDPAADSATAELCLAMESESGPLPETTERIALATALVQQGVCVGDPGIFVADG